LVACSLACSERVRGTKLRSLRAAAKAAVHLGQQQKAAKPISRRAAAKAAVPPGQQKKAAKATSRARNKTLGPGLY